MAPACAELLPATVAIFVVLPQLADEQRELPTVPIALRVAFLAFVFGICGQVVATSSEVQARRQGRDTKMPTWPRVLVGTVVGAFITLQTTKELPAFNESLTEGSDVVER